MKRIATICLLLIIATISFSQQNNPSPTLTKEDYLKKSKNQKTAAWILLGSGTIAGFVGLTQLNFAGSDNGEVNNTPGSVLFFTGLASVITSIPFFNASKKNKKKAMTVSFKNETAPMIQQKSFTHKTIPSLTFKVGL
jgi:hypothetical protein